MPTTTSPLTPATHGLRVAASFNVLYGGNLVGCFQACGFKLTHYRFLRDFCGLAAIYRQPY
jgi:hypothetical protein